MQKQIAIVKEQTTLTQHNHNYKNNVGPLNIVNFGLPHNCSIHLMHLGGACVYHSIHKRRARERLKRAAFCKNFAGCLPSPSQRSGLSDCSVKWRKVGPGVAIVQRGMSWLICRQILHFVALRSNPIFASSVLTVNAPRTSSASHIPFIKKDAGVRSLVVGERLQAFGVKARFEEVMYQLARFIRMVFAVPVLSSWQQCKHRGLCTLQPEEIIHKIDISNAYNSIDRSVCLRGVVRHCADLLRWAHWYLNDTSDVFWNNAKIGCAMGVQQGYSLAPMLVAVGVVVDELMDKHPEMRHIFFFDDSIHKRPVSTTRRAFTLMRSLFARIGLSPNPTKCEIYGAAEPFTGFDGVPANDCDAWRPELGRSA